MQSQDESQRISLPEARELAVEAVQSLSQTLEVVSATAQHDSTFIEILISETACEREPCRVLLSVDRDVTRDALRQQIADAVRRYLLIVTAEPDAVDTEGAGMTDEWDEISAAVDDVKTLIEEGREQLPEGVKKKTVDRLESAVDEAAAAADEIQDDKP